MWSATTKHVTHDSPTKMLCPLALLPDGRSEITGVKYLSRLGQALGARDWLGLFSYRLALEGIDVHLILVARLVALVCAQEVVDDSYHVWW